MQTAMIRLDAFLRRRRWPVLAAWLLAVVVAAPFAARQSENLSSGGFAVPGSQSAKVDEALARFPDAERTQLAVVLVPAEGAQPSAMRAAIERAAAAADGVERVSIEAAAREQALRQAAVGRTVIMPLHTDASEDEATEVATDLRAELGLGEGARDGVSTHLIGQGALWAALQELSKKDLAKAESAGFPLVLLILLAVFGSLAAAALPLALGFVSVLVTGALIFAISQVFQMSVFVTNMASMIGIGVAVDYSLFILARYREEVAAGRSPDDARATALATSGVAVLFSGLTVIISLAGLWMVDNNALRSMALGAMLVVAVSMLGSATLLPVLIRVLSHRAHTPGRVVGRIAARLRRPASTPRRDGGFWERWTEAVMRRPVLAVIGASLILLTLAAPALGLRMASGALEGLPADDDTRIGFEAASALAGPGASSPVLVMVTPRDGKADASEAAAGRLAAALERDRGIAAVAPPIASQNGQALLVRAQPGMNPESQEAKALVTRLRETLPRAAGPEVSVDVGGVTAAQVDIADLISGSMWKILVFLLGLSYIVLLILLRSVVLPAKAVLMNVLSVGAAYGVLTLVYEEVESLVPPLVLAVFFGLSMD